MKQHLHRSLAVAIVLSMSGLMAAVAQPALGDDGKSSTCNMVNQMTFSSGFLLDAASEPTVEDATETALETPFMDGTDDTGGTEVVAEDSDDASVVVKNKNGDGSAIIDFETTEHGNWAIHTIAECVDGAFSETEYLLAPVETTKWYPAPWHGGATPGYVIDNNIPSGRIDALKAGMANYSNRAGGNGPDFVYKGVTPAQTTSMPATTTTTRSTTMTA